MAVFLETVTGTLKVAHWVDNRNADQQSQAQELADRQARVLFKVENATNIELYRVKTYHDPVTPVNSVG